MTITAYIIESNESITTHDLESGEALTVAADQRVALPHIAGEDANITINDGDVLSISVDGQTLLLPGLLANIENETGSELTFADGVAVESLGTLLALISLPDAAAKGEETNLGMADLVREDAEGGDLFYLNDLAIELGGVAPQQSSSVEVLELGELVEMGTERDSLLNLTGQPQDPAGTADQTSDLWASTEFGGQSSEFASQPHSGDIIDLLLSEDDGIS